MCSNNEPESRLSALYFTRCTSGRMGSSDKTFCDVITVGGYPSEQKIIKIDSITVYMSADTELDVIVGLIVTYKVREGYTTTSVTVMHGDAMCSERVGTLEVAENELLVGATGQVSDAAEPAGKKGRLSFIEFAVYNRDTGRTAVRGPFGNTNDPGTSWGSYGPILALEGTAGKHGLISLGFTRLVHGVPTFGILGH
ncbi:hypothetical protein V8E55_006558 [Tylopilus felleus]